MGKDKAKEKKKEKKDKKKERDEDDLGLPPERLEKSDLLSQERVLDIEEHMRRNIYFSTDWSLPFYLAQAYHGFIATAYMEEGQPTLLLPEMQLSYAVLQHVDLHISRKTRRRSGRYRLTIDQRLDDVLAGVKTNHKNSWVSKDGEHRETLKEKDLGGFKSLWGDI